MIEEKLVHQIVGMIVKKQDVKTKYFAVSKVFTSNITITVSFTCSIVKYCRSSGQNVKSNGEVL